MLEVEIDEHIIYKKKKVFNNEYLFWNIKILSTNSNLR